MRKIYKYGLIVISNNKLLLCRPIAFPDLITPGGIKEGNEDHITNLIRETREELGIDAQLIVPSLQYLGNFYDIAAGRNECIVEIELYSGTVDGDLHASSEIKELIWYQPNLTQDKLSPIVQNKIIPFLIKKKLLELRTEPEQNNVMSNHSAADGLR
jgi:8-oxo-dGTP pyrophosphatase MutT (NUDIX family)